MGIDNHAIIFNKDSRFLDEIRDASVDLVVTSPPFNISHKYRTYHDSLDYEGFENLYTNVIQSIARVLKDNGFFVVDIADVIVMENNIIYGAEFIKERAQAANLSFLCSSPYIALEGSDEKMTSRILRKDKDKKFHSTCEQVLIFGKRFSQLEIAEKLSLKNCYKYSVQHDSAFWPQDLLYDILSPFELEDKVLLDPFMGSGTIGKMAIERGGRFIGYDIDKDTLKAYNWL